MLEPFKLISPNSNYTFISTFSILSLLLSLLSRVVSLANSIPRVVARLSHTYGLTRDSICMAVLQTYSRTFDPSVCTLCSSLSELPSRPLNAYQQTFTYIRQCFNSTWIKTCKGRATNSTKQEAGQLETPRLIMHGVEACRQHCNPIMIIYALTDNALSKWA